MVLSRLFGLVCTHFCTLLMSHGQSLNTLVSVELQKSQSP